MSRRNNRSNNIGIEVKVSLSQQRVRQTVEVANESPDTSPASSCVSSEDNLKYSSSPETTSMVVVGCPRCLMYVMLSEVDPRCPKCKSTVLLDLHPAGQNSDEDEEEDAAMN